MSTVRPMKIETLWATPGIVHKFVHLDDALRFAEERVAEALQLTREYGDGLEIELANDAFLQHHPAPCVGRRSASPDPATRSAAPAHAPSINHDNDPGDEQEWRPF